MAELDATQMPEEIIPSEEVTTTEESPEEVIDLNQDPKKKSSFKIQVPKPQTPKPTQQKKVTEEEKKRILEVAKPKTIPSISTETSLLQTSTEAVSTSVEKPVSAPLKSQSPLTIEGLDNKEINEYKAKKLEYELAPDNKKPEFKPNAPLDLELFFGRKVGKLTPAEIENARLTAEHEAIKAELEKDAANESPLYTAAKYLIPAVGAYDIAPNAIKSGITAAGSSLVSFAGLLAQGWEKAQKAPSVAGAAWGVTEDEKKASLPKPGEETSKKLYEIAQGLSKKSENQMIVAEMNSGIKEENIGKSSTDLLGSNKSGDGWDGLTKLGLSVTQQLPQLIALAVTSEFTGGVMVGATILGAGNAITEEYKKDQDISSVDAAQSIAKGVIEGLTEQLFMGDIAALRRIGGSTIALDMSGAKKTMKDYLAKRGRKAFIDKLNRTYFQAFASAGKNSFGEGFEELISAVGGFVVDRLEDGKWDQEEYDKLVKNGKESFLIGTVTGFAATGATIKSSVVPLTMDQKRNIVSYREVANDPTVDKGVREIAKKHADDIIKLNADLSLRKYSVIAALPFEKRKTALEIDNKIKGLKDSKAKLRNVEAEAQVDKDIKKLEQDWSRLVVSHAMEKAQQDAKVKAEEAKVKAERKATAPKVITSTGTEISQAAEAIEVDESILQGEFDILKGLTAEEKQTLVNILKSLQSIDPDGKIMLYENADELAKGLVLSGANATDAKDRAGFSDAVLTSKDNGVDPVVHINISAPSNAITSAGHEVAHVALLELAKDNPEAFIAMRDKVLRIMKSSQSKPLVDFASTYGLDAEGNQLQTAKAKQERAEEFLVEMIGRLTSGEGKIERTVLDQIARVIRDFLLQASRTLGNRTLEDLVNKTFENTTSSEQLAKYFEGLAAKLKVGGKIEVSHLRDVVPLTPAQQQRLEGLTPGSEQYHEAAQLNATENSPSNARPTMEADGSLVESPNDVVARSQMTKMTDSEQHKKYLRVVKGMAPDDIWLSRALAMDESRGGKLFAIGNKDKILEEMQKEMDQIEADAFNSNKYYLTELKPGYIAAQVAKYEKDPALTDHLTEWKMIRDDERMRERYIEEKQKEQKASLTGNIAYLKGNDTYSIPFQYAMIKDGISSRYTIEAAEEGGERKIQRDSIKPSQLNNTEKPIITMQPGIVAASYADYGDLNTEPGRGYLTAQINMPKIEVTQSEFAPFIFKQSDTGEGYWLKFNQSSNEEDAEPLFKIASTSHKYPAQWCTGGALSTAQSHLSGGDFYIFVDSKTGDARIAVRYKGKNEIAEVRGLGAGQAVLPEDGGIINELVSDLPGGKAYEKDAKIQTSLKAILDSLPDEFSKKMFTLGAMDFNRWLVDQNTGFTKEQEKEARDKALNDINDAVVKEVSESYKSAEEVIDFINAKDKSYGSRNEALKRAKSMIELNLDEVFAPLGYEKGSVVTSFFVDDNVSFGRKDLSNVRLVIGDAFIENGVRDEYQYSFPKLESVTGDVFFNINSNESGLNKKVKVSFPALKNTKGLILKGTANFDIELPSLETLGSLKINRNSETTTKLDLPKLKTINSSNSITIHARAEVNAPLLESISIKSDTYSDPSKLILYNKFNAPKLKTLNADLEIFIENQNDTDPYILPSLESSRKIEITQSNVSLPNLKSTDSIKVEDQSKLSLGEITFDDVSYKAKIYASGRSSIDIKNISFNKGLRASSVSGLSELSDDISVEIEAVNSEINIKNISRANGFNILGGIKFYIADAGGKINVFNGAENSWSDVTVGNKSEINLFGVDKIKKISVDRSKFSSNAKEISDINIIASEVSLPLAKQIFKLKIQDNSYFDAPKINTLGEVDILGFNQNISGNKINLPSNINNGGMFTIINSVLDIPWIGTSEMSSSTPVVTGIAAHSSTLSFPNLKRVSIKGIELFRSTLNMPILMHNMGTLSLSENSTLNAPNLMIQREEVFVKDESNKIFAPKLGYNGTSSPDATIIKSQMSQDIKKLDEAIDIVRGSYPTVKYWLEPEFAPESRGIPKTGTPATVVFGKKDNPEGVSDFVAYYSESGNLVSVLNMLTEPNKDSMSSKGAFKITVDPNERRKGYAKMLLNAAQDNGLDIIGNVKNNKFSSIGRDLVADWIKSKRDALIDQQSDSTLTVKSRLAPNGKPSNLTSAQYEAVRTPEFKAWFGDWENDPENASKFVDENGEPQVFYHGTYAEFERFSTDPEFKRYAVHKRGIFFTPTLTGAKSYGDIQMPVFLNAKSFDFNEANLNNSFAEERKKENALLESTDKEAVVFKTVDKESVTVGDEDGYVKQYVVFDPDQILLAGDKTYMKSQMSTRLKSALDKLRGKTQYAPGTSAAKQAEEDAKEMTASEKWQAIQKEITDRNVNVADALKNEGMMQSFYNLYNKAGATPFATRMFAEAHNDIYGKIDGNKLSSKDKGFLDDIILLRRTIAVDENFDNRKEKRPLHTSFVDYETKKEVPLSKEEALKQLEFLKNNVYSSNQNKLVELEYRARKYFEAFSDILKYKLDNGIIDQGEYDTYKNYSYQPRKFLKFILGDTPQSAFNTRGVQITRKEIKKIESGDEGYMMTDSEKLLKMGFVSAVNKVFSNRAKKVMFDELNGRNLGWAKPANYDTYANGTVKQNEDGSPKLMEPDAGYRNMTFKVDGKINAFQLKEKLAKEYEDTEMWDTRNWFYKTMVAAMGAKLTSAMAVGINPAFVISNISTDLTSQIHFNNLYSSKFGVFGQAGKGLSGVLANSLLIAKAKTGKGDNSRILNLINDYGKMGGMQNTLAYDTNFLGKVGEGLGMLGDISELAAKLTAFENKRNDLIKEYIKKNGNDPVGKDYDNIQMQAAYEARAAMDYHRGGRTIKFLNSFIPFLNVTTQASKISASYVKNNFYPFAKKMMQAGGGVMALTFYNMMMAGDDWENEDLKRAKRDKLIIFSPFKNADGTHSYNKYQVPPTVKFFWNVFQTIAENIYYKAYAPNMGVKVPEVDKTATEEMMNNLKMFVPSVSGQMPSSAKFFYEYATNKSLWNERALSQDALKNIVQSQEGEENPEILSFYKLMAKKASEITDGGIEISPERFQKASEDAFLTSPDNQALLASMYTIVDQMTNFAVGGVDEKTRSKYVADGNFSGVMEAFAGTFKKRLIGTTDKTKNEAYYDATEDKKMIDRLQREENSKKQNITNSIKTIFKNYKDLDLPYTDAKEEIMEYYKSIEEKRDKDYAKNYIEMMIGRSQVELKNNIPKYLLIQNQAQSSVAKAKAIYFIFTEKGQDPMTDKKLASDLKKVGFDGGVIKAYKEFAKQQETVKEKEVPVVEGVNPDTGLPPGFDPSKY